MDRQRKIIIATAAGTTLAALGLATLVMAPNHSNEPQHMSGLKVSGLSGYSVRDSDGRDVGEVREVQTDATGRTRFIRATLNDGVEVRIAAFRAELDTVGKRIDLTVPISAVVNDRGALIQSTPSSPMMVASAAPAR